MPASARTPEAILRRLEWTALRRLDGLLQGDYRTLFRGSGIDLANLREYEAGDDVRYIDWNVTARHDTLHVREYQEDRELTAWFLLDLSRSVDFGSDAISKHMVLTEFTAVMARLLTGKGNRCGALLFSAGVDRVVPPRVGRRHVLHLLERLAARPRPLGAQPTDLGTVLREAAGMLRRRSMVFVISDFISAPAWEKPLGFLARRHEVVAVRLFDPSEVRLPDLGLLRFQDAETGEQMLIDTNDRGFRRRFIAAAQEEQERLRASFARAGIDCLELSTEDDLVDAIVRFARMRRQRHRGGAPGALSQHASGVALSMATPVAPLPSTHLPGLHLPTLHLPAVSFLSPDNLWLLLLVPIAIAAYFMLLRRRQRAALRYGNFGMLKRAVGSSGRRRHVPPVLFLLALMLLLIGTARPTALISVFSHKSTVILTMDVSGSMRAADIKPSRVEAMQAAAKAFIAQQPKDVVVGIVAFASSALLVQPPTTDRASLNAAIDRFELQRGTAVGSGILMSLATLFPDEEFAITPYSGSRNSFEPGFSSGFNGFGGRGEPLGGPPKKQPVLVEPGSDKSAIIILLTDGATNAGPDPIEAAREAANHGVRVYTVGFGTTSGDIVGFGGRLMRAQLDEDSLKRIADMTRAQYYKAGSAEDLQAVYKLLSKSIVRETKETEITAFFAAAAAMLALLSAGLSLLWFSRIL